MMSPARASPRMRLAHTRRKCRGARATSGALPPRHTERAGGGRLVDGVALLLDLLVGPDLLALLAHLGDALLELLELRLGDLLRHLLLLDLVSEGVELVLLGERRRLRRLLLRLLARLLGGVHPLGATHRHPPVNHRPDLGAQRRVELALVRDDDAAAR